MVEPQEELVRKMMSQMTNFTQEIQVQKEALTIQRRVKENANRVANFQLEVQSNLVEIKMRFEAIRQKVRDNLVINHVQNCFEGGFLLGDVDDYLISFDTQLQKMTQRLEADKKYWSQKARELANDCEKNVANIVKYVQECQTKIARSCFFHGLNSEDRYCPHLVDLPAFGKAIGSSEDFDFRWPTIQQFKALFLQQPLPKLTEIKTSGNNDPGICSIQLIFEGGFQSPKFDSNSGEEYPVNSHVITNKDKKIVQVGAYVHNSGQAVQELILSFEDGQKEQVFQFPKGRSHEVTRQIPQNHVIVGVYGKINLINQKKICPLGFILLNTAQVIQQ